MGGWEDFKGDFHTPVDARNSITKEWYQVVDTRTKKIVDERTE